MATPAYAAVGGNSPTTSSASSAKQHRANGQHGMPAMGRMHEQMMKGMLDKASMEGMEGMMHAPGMAKMYERMMNEHSAI